MVRIVASVLFLFAVSFSLKAQLTADFEADTTAGCSPLIVHFNDQSTGSFNSWLWDLGNGNTSIYSNTQAVYSDPGVYTVTLTVSNGTVSDQKQMVITVYANPTASFGLEADAGCQPFNAVFIDSTFIDPANGGAIDSWTWDFGDGNSSHDQNPTHVYPNVGQYTVSLHVVDTNGCQDAVYLNSAVKVTSLPSAAFTADNTYTCTDTLQVHFSNQTTGGLGVTYQWQFGDGTSAASYDADHEYTTQGLYDVTLVATDVYGCQDSITKEDFIQLTSIDPSFALESDTNCLGQPLSFLYTPAGVSMFWDFGDSTTSTASFPNHVYADTGSYIVSLIVTDASGTCVDSVEHSVYVETIEANFSMDETYGCDSIDIQFTNLTSDAASWSWDFDDGSSSTMENPSHLFVGEGTYQIVMEAFTSAGCSDTYQQSVTIKLPVASFSATPLRLCVDSLVQFTDNSSSDEPITNWNWNFDDGNTSTDQNPQHSYTTDGEFNAVLTIVNSLGCTETDTLQIEVGTQQSPSFYISSIDSCASYEFEFVDISTDSALIDEWHWMFSDGGESSDSNAQHQFADTTGWFGVEFLVGYNGCWSDTLSDSLFIRGPIARIDTVDFDCSLQGDGTGLYTWSFALEIIEGDSLVLYFGDGDSLNLAFNDTVYYDTIVHNYTATGNYPVELIAFNDSTTCDFPVTFVARVRDIEADFAASDTLPCYYQSVVLNALDTAHSSNHAVVYEWTKIDDLGIETVIGAADNISHVFNIRGDYWVHLYVEDVNGCYDTIVKHLRVYQPQTGFIVDTISGCFPFDVSFVDTTPVANDFDTTIVGWSWNFGDGYTDTLQNPVHTYNQQGYFNVSLIATDVLSCNRTRTVSNLIVSPKPSPSFVASDVTLCSGDSIQYTNTTGTIQNYPANYMWNFGNGSFDSLETPAYQTYVDSGYYEVSLYAVDTVLGCDTTLTVSNYIHVQEIPVAYLVADPPFSNCYYPQVSFTFTDSTDHDYLSSWNWSFGDGAVSTVDSTTIHTYFAPDTFLIVMGVTTTYGCFDSDSLDLLVKGPIATINYPDTVCRGVDIDFHVSDTVNLETFIFNYGDGSAYQGNDTLFSHIFNYHGTKHPSFIMYSYDSCEVPVPVDSIHVYQLQADFFGGDSVVCFPYYQFFEDQSVLVPDGWLWSFGDGQTSTEQNPYIEYADTGSFNIKLVVYNNFGCYDSITKDITIRALPEISISDTSIICKGESVTFAVASEAGIVYTWSTGDTGPTITISPEESSEITVTDNFNCSDDIIVRVDQGVVDLPTAFSPNDDGNNDIIYVSARDVLELVEFKIFNRWGELLFETNDINVGWDGSYKSLPQNADTYVYMVKAITNCGKEFVEHGYITLLR